MSLRGREENIVLRGLRSDANQFLAPDGAMRTLTNMWLARPGLLQKRRGFTRWSATLTTAINKIFPYDGLLLAHCGTGSLRKITTGGAVSSYSGTYLPPDGVSPDWRTRGCIAGKNFYFNTSTDCYRLSGSASTPVKAGGIIATNLAVSVTGASGFLANLFSVSYRYVLGVIDNYGREILGPVSGRALVANSAGGTRNVSVVANLPSEATEANFIRIYRSVAVANGSQPDDDLKLVYEAQLKQADITAGSMTVTDIVTESLRGAFLYTSPNAGEGILQNNDRPPHAEELTTHKNRIWYANTRRPCEFELQILAVGGSAGIQNNDVLKINGTSVTLTATTGAVGANQYGLVTSGTAAFNIEQTALNLVAAINAVTTTNTIVYAKYISAPDDVPGRIFLFAKDTSAVQYNVFVGAGSQRDCFSPSMLPGEHIMNLSRVANVVTGTVTSGAQNFKVGEQVLVQGGLGAGGSTFGSGPFTVLTITGTAITYSESGANDTLAARSVQIYSDDIVTFDQETRVNRIYYSKFDEFEAVPRLNYLDVGRQDSPIIACVSASDQLWVFKRDGIFRIVGDDDQTFQVVDVDLTVVCNARETVTKFQGDPVGLTNKGMVSVTASGAEVMSKHIQKDILAQFVGTQGTWLEKLAFAVPYDSEEMLLLFFAGGKDASTGSLGLICNDGYIFCGKADEWASWSWDTNVGDGNGKTCGVVNPADDLLYFGDRYLTGVSNTFIYKERKTRGVGDFVDTRGDNSSNAIVSYVAPVIKTARAPGLEKLWQEVALLFNGTQPGALIVNDANEWASGGTHTIIASSNYTSRFWPVAARGAVLLLDITHQTANEAFDFAGFQIAYEVTGIEVPSR